VTAAANTAAEAERDRVLDEVTVAHQRALSPGMAVIHRWASTGREFSLNDCRAELRAAGVDGKAAPGALVRNAIQRRIIRKVRDEVSTDIGTHGKKIGVYVGTTVPPAPEAVTVPGHRGRSGRFSTPTTLDAPTLFEVAAS
jgi:hypothetical protein